MTPQLPRHSTANSKALRNQSHTKTAPIILRTQTRLTISNNYSATNTNYQHRCCSQQPYDLLTICFELLIQQIRLLIAYTVNWPTVKLTVCDNRWSNFRFLSDIIFSRFFRICIFQTAFFRSHPTHSFCIFFHSCSRTTACQLFLRSQYIFDHF